MAEERRFFRVVLHMDTNTVSSTEIGRNFYGQEGSIEFEDAFRISMVCSKTKRLAAERILKETASSYLRLNLLHTEKDSLRFQQCKKAMRLQAIPTPVIAALPCSSTQNSNLIPQLKIFIVAVCHDVATTKGAGGWGSIIQKASGAESTIFGGAEKITINRMELTGLVETLKRIEAPCEILLTSTSDYLVKTLKNGWLDAWANNGWKRSDGTAIRNIDLWKQVHLLNAGHVITCTLVKGIAPNTEIARCVKKAKEEAVYYEHSDFLKDN